MTFTLQTPAARTNSSKSSTKRNLIISAAIAAVALSAVGGFALYRAATASTVAASTRTTLHTVTSMDLDVMVSKDGELQAVENIEIVNRVEGRATIIEVVKEGSSVKKGETLIQLDSADIRLQIDDATVQVQQGQAALLNAKEQLEIQKTTNANDLEAATVSLQLAEINLQRFFEGTYPQQESSARTKLDMSRITLQNRQDDLAQTRTLFARGFTTVAEVKRAELAVTEATNSLDESQTALRVLTEYTRKADAASFTSAVAQAQNRLQRSRQQSESQLAQKENDVASSQQQLDARQRKLDNLKTQLINTVIVAPADGMVVYVNNRDQNQVIQQGAEVRERQILLRLPDTRSMKVVVRISEAMVSRLRVGQAAKIRVSGVSEPLTGTVTKISVLADSGNRWWNPDLKEYPVDIELAVTPLDVKPGVTASADIFIQRLSSVVAVPVSSIYSAGRRSFVFEPEGDKFTPREIKLGPSNGTFVHVVEGIDQGARVLLLQAGEGSQLLDKAGVKIEPETPRAEGQRPGGGAGAGGEGRGPRGAGGGSTTRPAR